jgi:hypothetical protein
MSWIEDVTEQIRKLDLSKKNLRRFGLLVGSVMLVLSGWMFLKDRLLVFRYLLGFAGLLLVLLGTTFPSALRGFYRVWMGAAFAVGWVVSRILLLILFVFVISPIGLIVRLFKKPLLTTDFDRKMDSYWVRKDSAKKINYEKMY